VTAIDIDHVAGLDADPPARARLYADSWLTLNDSRALELMAAVSGVQLPTASSAALCDALLAHVIDPDEPVAIIGGDAALIAAIAARYRLNNVRWKALSRSYSESLVALNEAAAFIARTRARYSFICVGAPAQEMIARAALRRGDATGVGLCVGDALHRLMGCAPGAPAWLRRFGLDGAHAVAREAMRTWGGALFDALRILPIWYYWLRAQLAERASISARNAF
jgi:UDP-N-acetyl-D-mannosaminuronic acid transferase (WecB/TagA/CpsF family)